MIILIIFLVLVFTWNYFKRTSKENFPAGPLSFPVIGSLLSLGLNVNMKEAFNRWRAQYGDIVGFSLGPQRCVLINDFDLLNEAFKDDRFTGRPAHLQEIFSAFFQRDEEERCSGGIVFASGEHWKEQRRFAMRTLKEFGVGKSRLQAVINEEVEHLVTELQAEAGNIIRLKFRTNLAVVNTLWQILNGEKSDPDPQMQAVFRSATQFIEENPLSGPLLILPWLRRLPLFRTKFQQARSSPQQMREVTSESIKKHLETFDENHQRDFIDCYIKKMMETTDEKSSFFKGHGEGNMQRTVTDLFGAGSETTSTVLCFAFKYLIRYPAMQERLAAEILAVVGRERQPTLEDRAAMPYTEAVIHEVLRHACITYTSPHATTEDLEFHGYHLPAGTAVYANVSWIMNDPAYWVEPERFNPDRFLDPASGAFVRSERCIPFLVGKRYCPGQQLAHHQLFLFLTGILQQLCFSTPLPRPDLVSLDPVVGLLHSCPDYEVIVTARQ